MRLRRIFYLTWNQKYLDYEIETYAVNDAILDDLGILKSKVSRLRDWNDQVGALDANDAAINLKSKVSRLRDWNVASAIVVSISMATWNQKYLDYEIETWSAMFPHSPQ